jgi:hypothetical protein
MAQSANIVVMFSFNRIRMVTLKENMAAITHNLIFKSERTAQKEQFSVKKTHGHVMLHKSDLRHIMLQKLNYSLAIKRFLALPRDMICFTNRGLCWLLGTSVREIGELSCRSM